MVQYMPLKRTKRGYKVGCASASKSGYTWDFDIYTGADERCIEGLGARVVKSLSKNLEGKGYCLFFDNFFSSTRLLEDLLDQHIYCVSTIRSNRKGFPRELVEAATTLNKERGASKSIMV